MTITDRDIAELAQRSADANQALVRGDAEGYLALTEHGDDYVLMAPFGGAPSRGFDSSPEYKASLSRMFKSGTLDQELVATYALGELAVLVTVEHVQAEVAGLPAQNWSLRVTQVFRREAAGWKLVHRHADPLTSKLNLPQAAAIARGEHG